MDLSSYLHVHLPQDTQSSLSSYLTQSLPSPLQMTTDDSTNQFVNTHDQQYSEIFRANDIDAKMLMSGYFTMGEMKSSLGIQSLGHRVKILQAIESMKAHTSEGR